MQLNNLHYLSRFGRFRSPENSKVRATTSKKKQKNWWSLLKQETESFLYTNPKSTLGPHKVGIGRPDIYLKYLWAFQTTGRETQSLTGLPGFTNDRPVSGHTESHEDMPGWAHHPVIFTKILSGSGIQEEQPEEHSKRSQNGRGLGSRWAL